MTVEEVLSDIEDMDGLICRIEADEENPRYHKIRDNDMIKLRTIFMHYRRMLCDLEIKE